MLRSSKAPSLFKQEFDLAIERWAAALPPRLQDAFRSEFDAFGERYEAALDTLESIWERRELAYAFDETTGLASRGSFRNYLITLLNQLPSRGLTAVAVLFIDVDDLKRLNDTVGHQAGDAAIAAVGAIVREALRQKQLDCVVRVADESYAVGRHGGDEFVAACPLSESAEIEKIAARLKTHVDDRDRQRAHGYAASIELTVSIGAVVYELGAEPPALGLNALATALVAAADRLMYQGKDDGLVHIARAQFTDHLALSDERSISTIEP
jgi:diguanylate cyclase (GGDEF)-like protein